MVLAFRRWMKCIAAIAVGAVTLFLGSVILCFGVPLAFGIVGDLMAHPGPVILALGAVVAIMIWRILRRVFAYAATSKPLGFRRPAA